MALYTYVGRGWAEGGVQEKRIRSCGSHVCTELTSRRQYWYLAIGVHQGMQLLRYISSHIVTQYYVMNDISKSFSSSGQSAAITKFAVIAWLNRRPASDLYCTAYNRLSARLIHASVTSCSQFIGCSLFYPIISECRCKSPLKGCNYTSNQSAVRLCKLRHNTFSHMGELSRRIGKSKYIWQFVSYEQIEHGRIACMIEVDDMRYNRRCCVDSRWYMIVSHYSLWSSKVSYCSSFPFGIITRWRSSCVNIAVS